MGEYVRTKKEVFVHALGEVVPIKLQSFLSLLGKENIHHENVSEVVDEAIRNMEKGPHGKFFAETISQNVLEKQRIVFIETENARLLREIEKIIETFMVELRSQLTLSVGKVALGGGG